MSMDARMLAAEARAVQELFALQLDPVFHGVGVPRGDGRAVLVIPGLFGSDAYLEPLHGWLRRIGYRPVRSGMAVNAGCPERLRTQVEVALQRVIDRAPGPVALIGHSRGGMLAWAIASRLQERASHLALLGSPAPAVVAMMRSSRTSPRMAGVGAAPVVQAGQRALRLLDPDCTVPACGCSYVDDLRRDLNPATQVLSVRSRDDQIVPPGASEVRRGENAVVGGTHSGLVYNRAVYPVLAAFLGGEG